MATTTLGPRTRAGLRVLGWTGLIICAILALGILGGRIWVGNAIGGVFTTADGAIGEGLASLDDARTRLSEGAANLDAAINELAAAPAASAVSAGIAARLNDLGDRYAAVRDRYVEARAKARSALLLAGVASGVVPGFEIPPAVAPALAAIDDRLTQLDARLRGLRTAASTTASDAVAAAQGLRTAVGTASDAAQNVRAQVEGLRVTIGNVQGGIERVLWIGAGGLLLIVGYVALLNALILWLGRRVPRPEAASITASTDPDPPEPPAPTESDAA